MPVALTESTQKVLSFQKDPNTGESLEHLPPVVSEQYERSASGPDVQSLLGEMRSWGQESLQQAYNREQKYGTEELSNGVGAPVKVLGNQVERYKAAGFGQKALSLTFQMNGFSGLQREGIQRYKAGKNWREVWYKDGRHIREEF